MNVATKLRENNNDSEGRSGKEENYYIEIAIAGIIKSTLELEELNDKLSDITDGEVKIMLPDGSIHKISIGIVNDVNVEIAE